MKCPEPYIFAFNDGRSCCKALDNVNNAGQYLSLFDPPADCPAADTKPCTVANKCTTDRLKGFTRVSIFSVLPF